VTRLSYIARFTQTFAAVLSTWKFDDYRTLTCRLGSGQRMKEVYRAREINVKKICGPNLDLRPGLFIDLSTFTPCRMILIQHITRVIIQYVSGAGLLITSQRYPRDHAYHVTETVVRGGDVIPKALVDILEEDGNDD